MADKAKWVAARGTAKGAITKIFNFCDNEVELQKTPLELLKEYEEKYLVATSLLQKAINEKDACVSPPPDRTSSKMSARLPKIEIKPFDGKEGASSMSGGSAGAGGWLVRLDRGGRDGARLALPRGRATLGRHLDCDVRVLQPAVADLHADLLVHANQTLIRNLAPEGQTLVNGQPVSVAALNHDDVITIGDRRLRWQYAAPARRPPAPAPLPPALVSRRAGGAGSRRGSTPAAWRLALGLPHRASAPGNAGGKQVAVVQPQRRDTNEPDSESNKEANTSRGRSRGKSSVKPAVPSPARAPRAPAASEPSLPARHSRVATPAKTPKKRQSRTPNTSASKRQARASNVSPAKSPANRQSANSPTKRQSAQSPATKRQSAQSPATKRQSTQSPAAKQQSTQSPATKRQSTQSPATKRQSRQSPVKRPSSNSPTKRQSTHSPATKRQSAHSPAGKQQSAHSPATKGQSTQSPATKRQSRQSPVKRQSSNTPTKRQSAHSPATKRQSAHSDEVSASANTSATKRQSRSPTVRQSKRASASPTKRQSTKSPVTSPVASANTSKRSSRTSSPVKRQSTKSPVTSPVSSANTTAKRLSSRNSSPMVVSSPTKRQATRSPVKSLVISTNNTPKGQSSRTSSPLVASPSKRASIRSADASPVATNASKRQSSRTSSPMTSPNSSTSLLVSTSKRQSSRTSSPKRPSIRSADASPVATNASKRQSSRTSSPMTSPNSSTSLLVSTSKRQSSRTSSPYSPTESPANSTISKRQSSRNASPHSPVESLANSTISKRKSSRTSSPHSPVESPAISTISKRQSSRNASPVTLPVSRQSSLVAVASPLAGRASGRGSLRGTRTPVATPVRVSPKSLGRRRALSAARSAPLRLAVLRRAQSAARPRAGRVTKIQAPTAIDHTKQAALLLMTRRTLSPPVRVSGAAGRRGGAGNVSNGQILIVSCSSLARGDTPLPTPRKSAMKDPLARGSVRKTDSIKFDLSNLENYQDDDVVMLGDSTRDRSATTEDDVTLHYSDTSATSAHSPAPSPRRSIHSRSGRMLENTGATIDDSILSQSPSRSTVTAASPRSTKSLRGSVILQKSLTPNKTASEYSRASSRTATDQSWDTTTASAFKTRTTSPRNRNLESYSIVDLVSVDDSKSESVYDSVGSTRSSSIVFGTPRGSGRTTRSTIDPNLLTSSTPYVKTRNNRSRSSPNVSKKSVTASRRSQSLTTTPENTQKHISVNSTRISRASRSKTRINESDLQYISSRLNADDSESPKSSRKSRNTKSLTLNTSSTSYDGMVTPENVHSPEEAGTPVLSIQSLLDSSQSSLASQQSTKRGRPSKNLKRKTIGVLRAEKKGRSSAKSKSLIVTTRKSLRSRNSPAASDKTDEYAPRLDNDDNVTPKSAVKLVPEAVKNKHSTAKKPQSKRSIIDNLNQSDMIKQLFNSPVKRKLSQSMTEFSRRQLFDDDIPASRNTRHTIAVAGSPDNSLLNRSQRFSPERFVSPLSTPGASPNLSGVKRLFRKNTPDNDLTNVKGVKGLLRTPRVRKSLRNDLTKVSGIKAVFAKSPKNRLSDVRVKEIFAAGPKNELTRLSGVRSLFHVQNDDLTDVRGVKKLFTRKSVANDLTNVSGVKKMLRVNTPKNDLRDVRGVRKMFQQKRKSNSQCDVSGIEELFYESNNSYTENQLEDLTDKPKRKSVYSKSVVAKRTPPNKGRRVKSLHSSTSPNVEQWLQGLQTKGLNSASKARKSLNKTPAFKPNVSRELKKLMTDTVEGSEPVLQARARNSSVSKSRGKKSASELYDARTLPIKKRSITEASLDKSRTKSTVLPIKKRAVVHSTPVRGRYNLTMNASELGRVSPIVPVDVTADADVSRPRQQAKLSPKGKTKASPKGKPKSAASTLIQEETIQIRAPASPKTRGRKKVVTQVASPKLARGRGRRGKAQETTATSPKSPKKAPTPKAKKAPRAKTVSENLDVVEPRTRRNRNNTEKQASVKESPKKGRRAVKVVSPAKKSPVKKSTAKKSPVKSPLKKSTKPTLVVKSPAKKSPIKKTAAKSSAAKSNAAKSPVKKSTAKKSPVKKSTKTTLVVKSPAKKSPIKKTSAKSSPAKSPVKKAKRSPVVKSPVKTPAKVSPKKTRGKAKDTTKSPVQAKPSRATRNKAQTETNTKKRRSSLVITKKPPVMSPRNAKKSAVKQTPKKVVSTRRQKAQGDKPKTPKNTRAKGTKTSVIITKASPVIKPGRREQDSSSTERKGRSTRNQKIQSPKKSPKVATPKAKRGRKITDTVEKASKKTLNKSDVTVTPVKRGRKAANVSPVKKGRKAAEKTVNSPRGKKNKSTEILSEPPVKRGRKTTDKANISTTKTNVTVDTVKKTRAAKGGNKTTQESKTKANKSVESQPTRARKTRTEDKPESTQVVGRKRKNMDDQSTVPAKLKKTEAAGGKRTASPVKETRGRQPARRTAKEEAKPGRGNTRAAASVPSPAAAGRAASGARRRR